jgi:hypothetical protein
VGGAGKPKNDAFRGVAIDAVFSAIPLDPRTLQRASYGDGGIAGLGLENMKYDLGRMVDAGAFAQIESNQSPQDIQKWQLLARELAQKQEIIHRMMRENDDKT